jgi:Carboxypeptidase regulatory-like domain
MKGLVFIFALAATGNLWAQSTGILRGQVIDPSGASIPGATITATGPDGTVKAAESDKSGLYSISGLPVGDYAIRGTATGFGLAEAKVNVAGGRPATLDLHLAVALDRQEVTVTEQSQVALDPSANASAVVLKADDLSMLADNPDDLQADLLALAGPSAGPSGGQIFIDGFSNGQLPPKESIREVRINNNPFSAEFDRSGMGRIEILTRPGTDKFHGSAVFNFADSVLNARNPFALTKPPTQMRYFQGNVSGPVTKKSSFTAEAGHIIQDQSALITAQVLDSSFNPINTTQNVVTPTTITYINPRFDYAVTPNLTLQVRYNRYQYSTENQGIGQFTLLSRGSNYDLKNNTFSFVETQVIGTRVVNESRFQYNWNRNETNGDGTQPAINVLSSFNGGGATVFHNYASNRNYEFQNYTSYTRGTHLVRFGVRIRGTQQENFSMSNFNGSFTFTSLDAYAATVKGIAQGLPFDQIRAQGGGALQYSVTGGTPLTEVTYVDAGPFVQEDWRAKPNLTVSLGLRYEIQKNIENKNAFAPRVGVAWGLGKGQGNGRPPKTVLRLGWGIFYDRIGTNLTLQALRQDGITQQNFVITAPSFYPVAPPVSQLVSNLQPQAIYKIDSGLQAPQMLQSSATVERQLPKNITLSLSYTNLRGIHQLRSRNINAPLPGTFSVPGTGLYPFGNSGQLFLYESSALFEQNQVTFNVNARVNKKISLFGYYNYNRFFSNSDGQGSFPVNNYDLSGEWGRARDDIRHRGTIGGNLVLPYQLQLSPNISLYSAPPLNITTGTDLNGDTNFNDRPGFATVAPSSSNGVVATRWGVFNSDPLNHPEYGSRIIPRNYGTGFGYIGINLRLSRTWTFGEGGGTDRQAAAVAAAAQAAGLTTNNPSSGSKAPGRYTVQLGIQARNALNHTNPASPIAILTSPFLGEALQSNYGANANRRLELNVRFGF